MRPQDHPWIIPGLIHHEKMTPTEQLERLLIKTCQIFEQDIEEVKSKKRDRHLVDVRKAYAHFAILKFFGKINLGSMATIIGRDNDHSSMLYYNREYKYHVETERILRTTHEKLCHVLCAHNFLDDE